ncbi:hypothetical protein PspLS_09823 [Pyricularia sp. CBS 133598]|nr:hypothetical protein PspLS_09823 [Pyricularia sp. CBS 133598]
MFCVAITTVVVAAATSTQLAATVLGVSTLGATSARGARAIAGLGESTVATAGRVSDAGGVAMLLSAEGDGGDGNTHGKDGERPEELHLVDLFGLGERRS